MFELNSDGAPGREAANFLSDPVEKHSPVPPIPEMRAEDNGPQGAHHAEHPALARLKAAGSALRVVVNVCGDRICGWRTKVHVPEGWARAHAHSRAALGQLQKLAGLAQRAALVLGLAQAVLAVFATRSPHQKLPSCNLWFLSALALGLGGLDCVNDWPDAVFAFSSAEPFAHQLGTHVLGAAVSTALSTLLLCLLVSYFRALAVSGTPARPAQRSASPASASPLAAAAVPANDSASSDNAASLIDPGVVAGGRRPSTAVTPVGSGCLLALLLACVLAMSNMAADAWIVSTCSRPLNAVSAPLLTARWPLLFAVTNALKEWLWNSLRMLAVHKALTTGLWSSGPSPPGHPSRQRVCLTLGCYALVGQVLTTRAHADVVETLLAIVVSAGQLGLAFYSLLLAEPNLIWFFQACLWVFMRVRIFSEGQHWQSSCLSMQAVAHSDACYSLMWHMLVPSIGLLACAHWVSRNWLGEDTA